MLFLRYNADYLEIEKIQRTLFGNRLFTILLSYNIKTKKSNLHHTRGLKPKRVTSDVAPFRGLAPGQHSSDETSQRRRTVDATAPI